MLRSALFVCLFWLACTAHAQTASTVYVCTPCGYDCDKEEHSRPGKCGHCSMDLVPKSSIVFKNLTPAEVCQTVTKNPKVILLDVRTPDEFNGKAPENFGRLKGAINIPVQELDKRLAELSKYKKSEIIVYCSHSHRSPRASYLLTQHGFTNVRNMSGGMSVWDASVSKPQCTNILVIK
jgi:rhodanese-related sulfurtransferase/DNA-directed RNA polymerase subunit RPC12/RpoP